jgi:uncharacterized protein
VRPPSSVIQLASPRVLACIRTKGTRMSNVQTVQEIYAAFGRGDVDVILECLAPDIAWEAWADHSAQNADVPWLVARDDRQGVAEFFALISEWETRRFEILDFMASDNQVVVEVATEWRLPSGAELVDEELHLWTFDESGVVVRFRHYVDTAKHLAAAGVPAHQLARGS